jgi:hypothetical protein
MVQCKGKTKSGERCKLDAQPGSDYCHLHGQVGDEAPPDGAEAEECAVDWEDLKPIIVAGAMLAGMFFLSRALGKWIPR